ncbi:MAG: endolytic transglycosylase MltG [Thermovirgaceae bacterium]|nr:endolytic transglycosylase MltG [Thermovirgaceae bacterium]
MKRTRRQPALIPQLLTSAFIFLISAVFFVGLSHFLPVQLAGSIKPGKGEPVLVLVEPGVNAGNIARHIADMGLTTNPGELSRWFTKLGIDRSIRPGIYSIRSGSPWEIARQMAVSVPKVSTVTILPGETFEELLERLGPLLQPALEDDDLFPEGTRSILPTETRSRIAYILPDTYNVSPSSKSARDLIRCAAATWWKKIGSKLDVSKFDGQYLFRKAVLASLVEKEARLDEERVIIAGIIENRHSSGMRLQIDATVVYAWSLKGVALKRVLYSHLEIDSPFNTYLYTGFPPAPICVPSSESWKASLEPRDVPYVFYVAKPDGSHFFSVTYQEHLEAVNVAREAFDSMAD